MKNGTVRLALLLAAAVVLFWWPASKFQFLNYDDNEYVFENKSIREGLSLDGVKWAFNCGYAANWHPLAWISLMADVSLVRAAERLGLAKRDKPLHDTWTLDCDETALARTMHVHNILLHALNAVLLFWLLAKVGRKWRIENEELRMENCGTSGMKVHTIPHSPFSIFHFTLVLLWAVHPLRCEVVCWVSERKELVSVFFMLLALLFWLKSQTQKQETRNKKLFYSLALLAFFFALLAKPVAVTLPLVLFAYDWMICRIRFCRAALRTLPFAVMSLVTCLFTLSAQREAMPGLGDMSAAARISCVLKAPLVYLAQTVFPYGISSWYAVPRRPEWIWAAAGALLVAAMAAVLVWWLRSRSRRSAWAAFTVVWLYGGLLPMLGIVKVGGQPHCDRYTYWVGCGFAVSLAMAAAWAFSRLARSGLLLGQPGGVSPRMLKRALALVLLPYAICGFVRMFVWHDSLALFRDGYENSREPDQAYTYASNLMPAGRYAEAEEVMREAASVHHDARTHARLALVLAQKEKSPSMAEARHLAESALAGDPKVGEAHAALGHICLREGRTDEAIRHYVQAGENGFNDRLVEKLLADHRQGKTIGLEARK